MAMTDAGGADYTLSLKDDLTSEIKTALAGAVSAVKATKDAIDTELKSIGAQVQSVGKSLTAIGAGAAALGGASVIGFGKAVQAAGDFAETLNMFEAVFKGQSDSVRAWAKEYQTAVGRSEAQLLNFLAQAQDTFIPLGFDRQEATELSKTVTKLAVDLASFKNISDDDALRRLIGGLVGNTENLKAFGVQANEAAIKAKALSLGFDPKNLTSYQKALAILQITLDGTQDAQGDAIRTAGSFVNSVKALKAEVQRLNQALGEGLKDAVTKVIRAVTSLLSGVNSLLEQFPVLSRIGGAAAIALTGIGVAAVTAGIAIKAMGGTFLTLGILALGPLIKAHGVMGALTIVVNSTKIALTGMSAVLAAQAAQFRTTTAAAVTFSGVLSGMTHSIGALGATLANLFRAGALKVLFAGIVAGFKTVTTAVLAAFSVMFRAIMAMSATLAATLTNPWVLLATAIGAAIKLAELYYKKQEEREKVRGQRLEDERQRIVAQSFRDAGQAVPTDLSKTFDPTNAKVIQPQTGALSQADRDLADEIKNIKTSLESFRERIDGAQRLLDRGTINQDEFKRFAQQELDSFRKNDPTIQKRSELVDQLMTPIERFNMAVTEAAKVFRGDPEMFKRARSAALEQFKASDRATQMAIQLHTPLEQFQAAIAEAREVFANSPENFRRAAEAAFENFKSMDPVEQLRLDLRTPVEIFQERMAQVRKILRGVADGIRDDLMKRAMKQAKEDLRRADPDRAKADEIRNDLKKPGERIAEQLVEAFDLVKKGLLDPEEFKAFAAKLKEDALGPPPEVDLAKSIGTQNANVAAKIGAFAPTFTDQGKILEYARKQAELQQDIRDGIIDLNKKKDVFGR